MHCPTGALDEDYRLDARKCLAYWSIEHRGPVPLEFWPYFKDFAFGCDICQNVCPKNRPVVAKHGRPELSAYQKLGATLDLEKVLGMNQKDYEELFGGTPLTRAKFVGLKRNAIIASVAMADTDEKIQELTSTWQDRHLASWKLEDDAHKTLQKTFEMIEGYKA